MKITFSTNTFILLEAFLRDGGNGTYQVVYHEGQVVKMSKLPVPTDVNEIQRTFGALPAQPAAPAALPASEIDGPESPGKRVRKPKSIDA